MTEEEVRSHLNHWAAEKGSRQRFDDLSLDFGRIRDDLWVITPAKRANIIYVATAEDVRVVHPSQESIVEVLRQLGADASGEYD
ncbi:hypothetical protein [Kineosporia babensis]|uniref:Uncharacterized protein n=1 Tax=Kineosporia babensis TaxID=499548 RepID=A0A9X1SRF1_9ACTN|nr:hypothetical protein [Kineosporia babensis]MCD5309549.1 hypothetical protein [Kineosporia babensis]